MRHSFTSTVELQTEFTESFASEPYEAGWASEALFFVTAHTSSSFDEIAIRTQISPDGIHWIDEGTDALLTADGAPVALRLHNFGNWLRVVGDIRGNEAKAEITVHLSLKS